MAFEKPPGGRVRGVPFAVVNEPQCVDEMVLGDSLRRILAEKIASENQCVLMLYGPRGTGKSTFVNLLVRERRAKRWPCETINASHDNGIAVTRRLETTTNAIRPCLIVMEEADNMTPEAQRGMRLLFDKRTHVSFVFVLNNVERIIDALKSRSLQLHFPSPTDLMIRQRLEVVARRNGFEENRECLDRIVSVANGDMRVAMNYLGETRLDPERTKIFLPVPPDVKPLFDAVAAIPYLDHLRDNGYDPEVVCRLACEQLAEANDPRLTDFSDCLYKQHRGNGYIYLKALMLKLFGSPEF